MATKKKAIQANKTEYIIQYQFLVHDDSWTDDILAFKPFSDLEVAKKTLEESPIVRDNIRSGYRYRILQRVTDEGEAVYHFPEEKPGAPQEQ